LVTCANFLPTGFYATFIFYPPFIFAIINPMKRDMK
jgi:hypothetical protein